MIISKSDQAQLRIYERLARLDEETQERISLKYYHGTRPWLKRNETAQKRRKRSADTKEQEE